jgi:hypothetical protein
LLAADCSNPPDTVLFNGKIFTGDASHPYVQALAIRGKSDDPPWPEVRDAIHSAAHTIACPTAG